MKITASTVSLNVADERASADFLRDHFGFTEEMSADGFVFQVTDPNGVVIQLVQWMTDPG